MSKFVTTVEYGGAHNLAADITANVTTGQSRQFFKQILCRAVNKGPIGSFCWRSIFSSTSFWNGKITMKFLILNSRKISQICVWAWTENTNYRYLSTLKYGGFTNFIIFWSHLWHWIFTCGYPWFLFRRGEYLNIWGLNVCGFCPHETKLRRGHGG